METIVVKRKHLLDKNSEKQVKQQRNFFDLTRFLLSPKSKHQKKLIKTEYWFVEVDKKTGESQRAIGFDKRDRPVLWEASTTSGFWANLHVTFDISQDDTIDQNRFNDIWVACQKRDMKELEGKIDKYLELWTTNQAIPPPKFPIVVIGFGIPHDIQLISNVEQITKDIDSWGYRWGQHAKLIDSKGNVYSVDYINFGHPVGCVFPKEVERQIGIEELRQIVLKGYSRVEEKLMDCISIKEIFDLLNDA